MLKCLCILKISWCKNSSPSDLVRCFIRILVSTFETNIFINNSTYTYIYWKIMLNKINFSCMKQSFGFCQSFAKYLHITDGKEWILQMLEMYSYFRNTNIFRLFVPPQAPPYQRDHGWSALRSRLDCRLLCLGVLVLVNPALLIPSTSLAVSLLQTTYII